MALHKDVRLSALCTVSENNLGDIPVDRTAGPAVPPKPVILRAAGSLVRLIVGEETTGAKNRGDRNSGPNEGFQKFGHCKCPYAKGREVDLCTGVGHDGRPDPSPKDSRAWLMKNCASGVHVSAEHHPEGAGDTIEYILKRFGVYSWIKKNWGNCGCERRKHLANKALPYSWKIWRNRCLKIWSSCRVTVFGTWQRLTRFTTKD